MNNYYVFKSKTPSIMPSIFDKYSIESLRENEYVQIDFSEFGNKNAKKIRQIVYNYIISLCLNKKFSLKTGIKYITIYRIK